MLKVSILKIIKVKKKTTTVFSSAHQKPKGIHLRRRGSAKRLHPTECFLLVCKVLLSSIASFGEVPFS